MWAMILRGLLGEIGPLLELIVGSMKNRHVLDQAIIFARAEVAKLGGDDTQWQAAEDGVRASLRAMGTDLGSGLLSLAVDAAFAAAQSATVAHPVHLPVA